MTEPTTFLINVGRWALSIECETIDQAKECAKEIGGIYLGPKDSDSGWLDIDVTRYVN